MKFPYSPRTPETEFRGRSYDRPKLEVTHEYPALSGQHPWKNIDFSRLCSPTILHRHMARILTQWAFHRVQEHPNEVLYGRPKLETSYESASPSRLTTSQLTSSRLTSGRLTSSQLTSGQLTHGRLTSGRLTSSRLTSYRLAVQQPFHLDCSE